MNIVTVDGITKAYGERKLFDQASFFLQEGEKAGIIGINGTGKSTLLKIIAGMEHADSGNVILANHYTIEYLPQTPSFEPTDTVLQAVCKKHMTAETKWTIESEAKSMMTKLGIMDFEETWGHLSGGQKKRLALVSALLAKADILLLDEPTNHLDHAMSSWLEGELRAYKGSIIMVTHDRYFLDSVANRIIEVDKGQIYSYATNYSGYLEGKTLREDIQDAQERKRQSILRVELAWVQRGARARSTKQKARLERYEEMKQQAAPLRDAQVEIGSVSSRLGRTTIELSGITKRFGDKTILNDFTYYFLKNDRIGIVGKNGCGKSTLLKIMQGILEPDAGSVVIGPTVKIGYFAQEIVMGEDMNPNQRVIDYIRDVAEYVETDEGRITAARLLERFLFRGEDQYGLIGKLSGGERRRLYLCRVLMAAPNVLILDEPTNDLDITTLTILENYLDSFQGIVVAVSHDRYFLDRVVRRIFAFPEDGSGTLWQSEGGYTDYETRLLYEAAKTEAAQETANRKKANGVKSDNWKEKPRVKKRKLSYQEQRDYETIEADIEALEQALAAMQKRMEENASNSAELQRLYEENAQLEQKLAEKMERWMYLEELLAEIQKQEG